MQLKTISVITKAKDLLPFQDLIIVQDNFKDLYQEDFLKAKRSLIEFGIARAFKIGINDQIIASGKYPILDGSQMYRVLKQLAEEMWVIPDLVPVEYIQIDSEEQMHRLIMEYAAVWGKVTMEGLEDQSRRAGIEPEEIIKDLRLPDFKFEIFEEKPQKEKKLKTCPNCKHQF